MAQKDHYNTLGVAPKATADDIKKAYRRLAKKYHPDATGGDKAKEAKFKEISEAYEVLSDNGRRAQYDNLRNNPFPGGGFPGGGFPGGFPGAGGFPGGPRSRTGGGAGRGGNIDIEDFLRDNSAFQDLFSEEFGADRKTRGGRRPQKGADLSTTLELSLIEGALGVEKILTLEPDTAPRRVTVRIPAGVHDEETIRVPGHGRPGARGGPPGDLLLKVKLQPHPQFRRNGADVDVDVRLRIDQAILGTKADVPTLEGKVQLTIPPGTSSGLRLRLRGKGAGDRKGGRGDLYAVVQITVPQKITEEAREALARFISLTEPDAPR